MPETVEDDGEKSDGTPSDDLESAAPLDLNKGGVKFGWIRGVLVRSPVDFLVVINHRLHLCCFIYTLFLALIHR